MKRRRFKWFQVFADIASMRKLSLPVESWNERLARGDASSVKSDVLALNLKQVKRSDYERLCVLAHRLNLPQLILRLLNPVVRAEQELLDPATPGELAEYAMALNRIGATEEAKQILEGLKESEFSRIWLYQAFANMTRWNYSKAATCLKRHLKGLPADSKAAIVGQVNLSACLIFLEKTQAAKDTLQEIIQRSRGSENQILFGNANELLSQVYLQAGELNKAKDCLDQAESVLKGTHGLGPFFVKKWQQVLKAKQEQDPELGFQILEELKSKAKSISHWETVRDCEYFQCDFDLGEKYIKKLYFGTPFKGYRKRLKDKFNLKMSWRHDYLYLPETQEPLHIIDVSSGDTDRGELQLGPASVLHNLLFEMTRDFYRPITLGSIFSKLYKGEYFDPDTSLDRAFKSIQRLRNEFKKARLPLSITEDSGGYSLNTDSVGFRVTLRESLDSKEHLELKQLKTKVGDRTLKLVEVSEVSGWSESKVRSILNHSSNSRSVRRIGSGPGTRYKLVG